MRELLEYILSEIVTDAKYKIEEEGDDVVSFIVYADKDIIGLLIGKNGKTVRAIRNLLRVRATLENKVVNLSITES